MERSVTSPLRRSVLIALALLAGPVTPQAMAQGRPAPSLHLAVGWVGFADNAVVNETLVGASMRWHVSPRFSIGPEVAYMDGSNHSHLMVTGNVTWDLGAPSRGRVVPFLVAGGGLFRTSERFVRDTVTSREGAFTVGGGVRTSVGDRVTVGLDARVGWEPHIRVAGLVGLRLGS